MPNFPYIGSRLEVLTTIGVRYRGRLKEITSDGMKSITLDQITHYGNEGRPPLEGYDATAAKGPYPPDEIRVIHDVFISSYTLVPPGHGDQQIAAAPAAVPPVNAGAPANNPVNGVQPGPTLLLHPAPPPAAVPPVNAVAAAQPGPAQLAPPLATVPSINLANVLNSVYVGVPKHAHPAQVPPPTQQDQSPPNLPLTFVHQSPATDHQPAPSRPTAASLIADDCTKFMAQFGGAAQPVLLTHAGAVRREPPSPPAIAREQGPSTSSRANDNDDFATVQLKRGVKRPRSSVSNNGRTSSSHRSRGEERLGATSTSSSADSGAAMSDETGPTYFIAQVLNNQAVGVLTNQSAYPDAPVYVGAPHYRFSQPVLVGQHWCIRYTTAPSSLSSLYHAEPPGDDTPWMSANGSIQPEAEAVSRGMRLIRSAPTERRTGSVSSVVTFGKHRFIKLASDDFIKGVQLGKIHYKGVIQRDFLELATGDRLHVDCVRLEAGTWVGRKFVLPGQIDYHHGRAPYHPLTAERKSVLVRRVRAGGGELFPCQFERDDDADRQGGRARRSPSYSSSESSSSDGERGGGSASRRSDTTSTATIPSYRQLLAGEVQPVYFIAQFRDISAVGVLVNQHEQPSAPVYVRIDYAYFRSHEPAIGQLWRVGRLEHHSQRTALNNVCYSSGVGKMSFSLFVSQHGFPWLRDGDIIQQAMATQEVELVAETLEHVTSTARVVRARQFGKLRVAEVQVPAGIEGVQIGDSCLYNTREDKGPNHLAFITLKDGDNVEVESVRLPAGCYVGHRFVLPAGIAYHNDSSPFKPRAPERNGIVTSREGQLFPYKINFDA